MAYNASDQFFEQSTDTNGNFGNSVGNQNNSFFLPKVYSKQVLNFFRKSSVAEAITNTDYAGEITNFGDSVRIIKEPSITVYQYERGADVTQTKLPMRKLLWLLIRQMPSNSKLMILKLICPMSIGVKQQRLRRLTHCVMPSMKA